MNSQINANTASCVRPHQNPNGRMPSPPVTLPTNGIRATQVPVLLTPTIISSRPTCVSASRLLHDESIRTPEELIPGLLHMGTKGMLVGASKCGKTWLLMDLAISVATGTPFLRWPCNAGKVLYINFEIDKPFFRTRLQTMLRSRNLTAVENLHTLHLRGTSTPFPELVQEIIINSRVDRYALIILDPIYKATASKSDGAGTAVANICTQLDYIANQTGAVVVFAHHFNKGKVRDMQIIDRMSGSGTWARDLDTIISVTDLPLRPGYFVVETKLRNYETFPSFVIRRDGSEIEVRDDIDPPGTDESMDANDRGLLQLLGAESMTSNEFLNRAESHNIPRSTFYRVLRTLQRNGRIYHDVLSRRWAATRPPRLNAAGEPPPVFEPENRILWLNETNETNETIGTIGTIGTIETQEAGGTDETDGTQQTGGTDETLGSDDTPPAPAPAA